MYKNNNTKKKFNEKKTNLIFFIVKQFESQTQIVYGICCWFDTIPYEMDPF